MAIDENGEAEGNYSIYTLKKGPTDNLFKSVAEFSSAAGDELPVSFPQGYDCQYRVNRESILLCGKLARDNVALFRSAECMSSTFPYYGNCCR